MRNRIPIKAGIVCFVLALVFACTACTLGKPDDDTLGPTSNAGSGVDVDSAPRYFGEFLRLYPNEYASFVSGGTFSDENGQIHSHAALRFHTESSPMLQNIGAPCLSCKTAEFNALFERYGEAIYNMGYSEVSGEVVDFFSCRTCHAYGVPSDGAAATLEPYVRLASAYLADIDPEIAACGQCHNATCDWPRYLIGKSMDLDQADPYRYGSDADSLRRAAEEDGIYIIHDDELGTDLFYLGHPDIELFIGSEHQRLGLSCVSCHMPYESDADGASYRSHDSSGSPIANENAMRFCLTCHESQGISNTKEMREFIWQRQDEMASLESDCLEKLETLRALIISRSNDGRVSKDVLDLARENYQTANYYYQFQHAGARSPGVKAAHSAETMRGYLKQCNELLDEAISLLE